MNSLSWVLSLLALIAIPNANESADRFGWIDRSDLKPRTETVSAAADTLKSVDDITWTATGLSGWDFAQRRAAPLINQLHDATSGDYVLVVAVEDFMFAKAVNGRVQTDLVKLLSSKSEREHLDANALYDLSQKRLITDPAYIEIQRREKDCSVALHKALGQVNMPPGIPECEDAAVDAKAPNLLFDTALKPLDSPPDPSSNEIGQGCAQVVRSAQDAADLILVSIAGVLGDDTAHRRALRAEDYCRSVGEQRLAHAASVYTLLRSVEIVTQLTELRQIHKARTIDDFYEQSGQEWERAGEQPSVQEARAKEKACDSEIARALSAKVIAASLTSCVVPAKLPKMPKR